MHDTHHLHEYQELKILDALKSTSSPIVSTLHGKSTSVCSTDLSIPAPPNSFEQAAVDMLKELGPESRNG